jgi:hypothetical protein
VISAAPDADRSRSAHGVETLRWELRYPSARIALGGGAMKDRLERFLRSEGLRHIAACFDRHDTPGLVWRIDRLELDLGRLSHRQDEHQWAARLDEALDLALLNARQRAPARGLASTRLHAIEQFLFYLLNGHLPWGFSLPGRHAVANWLACLAREHGPRLWTALQGHPERNAMLARLAQISPHHGLHALLAARDAMLANALQSLDDSYLAPLQAHGWLGAHQRQQLQQALRVAGLRASWGARGSALAAGRRPSLLEALGRVLAEHLGPAWATRLAAVPAANVPVSAAGLFRELIALPSLQPQAGARGEVRDGDLPTRTWEVGLQELRMALSRARPHSAALSARVAVLLDRLAASHPSALRNCLLQWAGERRQRRQWSQCLAPGNLGTLLAAMCPSGASGPAPMSPHAPPWMDSLRQTALRMQREAPADRRPRLGRLQALLMEACLQRLAEGRRLPDSHSAWQALWHAAWAHWLGDDETHARPPAAPLGQEPAHGADPSPSHGRRERPRAQGLPAASGAAPRAGLDAALRGLERRCQEGRWAWPERLRLARLLETDSACERWLQLFDESSRWQMLRAQFGAAARRLQERAGHLQQWLAGVLHEPLVRAQEHWRRLCRYLFVQGLSPDQAALRSHYQVQAAPKVAPTRLVEAFAPIWVGDAGQVILMAYAERLFKQQGLLDQGHFIDGTARARAVQCLQTLCHGEGAVDEAQTVLSRLLCGASPADLLPAVDPLPPETVALLEQLLQAVITHWKAVGHTSVAGLRESFLQREGRLQRDRTPDDEPPRWHLRVQPRGIDVLLDRLPWSFQTIRLPWMQGALHVEWR